MRTIKLVCALFICAALAQTDVPTIIVPTTNPPTTTPPTTAPTTAPTTTPTTTPTTSPTTTPTTTPTTVPPTTVPTATPTNPTVLPSVIPTQPPAIPIVVNESKMLKDLKDHKVYQSKVRQCIFPYQQTIVMNEPVDKLYVNVTSNSTILYVAQTFLQTNDTGEMVPYFNLPVANTVMTVRVQMLECYPEQGGAYYRNDYNVDFGNTNNELVVTRATDSAGNLLASTERNWQLRPEDAKSIVVYSADEGIIFCSNIEWEQVDGSLSSIVSLFTLAAVVAVIARRAFL